MKHIFTLFFALLVFVQMKAQVIVPTQTDAIIIDNGTPGKADPNDRIRYKVTIQNTGGTDATGVQLNTVPDLRTMPVGSFISSPVAVNDAYTCTGNVGISVPAANGVKVNDFDDNLAGATLGITTPATNGAVALNIDGSFTYTPNAGFTGTDMFTYTMTDVTPVAGAPLMDVATVTITVSNIIWFVDNTGGGAGGAGTLSNPFKTLADFNGSAGPLAGHLVFIKNTGTNYNGGIVLKDNMSLFGTGHTGAANLSGVLPFSLAPNSPMLPNINGTRPVITNASGDGVTMAMNNSLRGFDVGACSDFGMDNTGTNSVGNLVVSEVNINNTTGGGFDASNGSGASMNAVFGSITSSGGVNGIDLTSCAGTFTVNGGTITNPTGTGVLISGGSVVFSTSGVITDNTGFAVDVSSHSGNATFSGNITSTGTGIRVQSCTGGTKTFSGSSVSLTTGANTAVTLAANAGAIINISGGSLVTTTTSGGGYSATGGGTVSVTGANNTITSTTGVALNISTTTIGASNVTFKSIAANGALNGIVLNTTGASGGLVVTGTGTTDGSGGTIQNITNRGVSAISTMNLSLKNMAFNNANTTDDPPPPMIPNSQDNAHCNAAIHMNAVTNATLDNVDINGAAQQGINLKEVSGFQLLNSTVINCGAGGQTEEADLYALNLFGTCAITNSSLTVPSERAAVIYNTNKTLALTVTSSTFGMNQTQPLGADGLEVSSFGTSNTTLNIVNSTFVQPKTNGLQVIGEDNSVSSVNISGSTFDPGTGLAAAMDLDVNESADMKFNILNNPMIKGKGINILNVFAFPDATFEGRINGNTVVSNGGSGSGIRVHSQGNGNTKVEIKNNTVSGITADIGIDIQNQGGSGRMDATVTGNNVSITATAGRAIQMVAGGSGDMFTNKICGNVANNTTVAPMGAIGTFQARAEQSLHEFILQGGGSTVGTNWDANGNSPTVAMGAIISQSGSGLFTFGPVCAIPTNP